MTLLRRSIARTKSHAIATFAFAAWLSIASSHDARADQPSSTWGTNQSRTQNAQTQNEDEGLSDAVLDARGSVKRAKQSLEAGSFMLAKERAHEAIRRAGIARDLKSYIDALIVLQDVKRLAPHVTFVPPDDVEDLNVSFDGRIVETAELMRTFTVDAGDHDVRATATRAGLPVEYNGALHLERGEFQRIVLSLTKPPPYHPSTGNVPVECFAMAKNREELMACVKTGVAPK